MHPSIVLPCAPPAHNRPSPCPHTTISRLQPLGRVTASVFLRSLAMRSSSWRGPSGRARGRSRRGWRGCGGRSRRTWSWPSHSARPTCPPPRRRSPRSACRRAASGAGLRKEKTRVCIYTLTAALSHVTCHSHCYSKDSLVRGPWGLGASSGPGKAAQPGGEAQRGAAAPRL